jgi:hypothetical protein
MVNAKLLHWLPLASALVLVGVSWGQGVAERHALEKKVDSHIIESDRAVEKVQAAVAHQSAIDERTKIMQDALIRQEALMQQILMRLPK